MEETKVTNSQDQDKSSFVVLMLTLGLRNLFALTTPPSKAKLCGPQQAVLISFFLSFFFFVFAPPLLSVQFIGFKYIHVVLQPLPQSISELFIILN